MAYADGDVDTIADDGMERSSDESPLSGLDALDPVEHDLGYILEEQNESKVAKHVVQLREDRNEERSRLRATSQRNIWWRQGRRGVRLEKKQDQGMWEAKLPAGMGSAPPVPNKTDRLCRRVTNTVQTDKPFPECTPEGDDSMDADAAQFATRYLVEKGEKLNMTRICRSAMDKGHTFGSAFGWATMDPYGGGHRPRTVQAHPQAQTIDDATIDPMTQQPADESVLVKRYVRPDRNLTDNPKDADMQWMPDHKVRLLNGLQLDMLPAMCRHIDEADGVLIADTTTLGDLKKTFPDVMEQMEEKDIETLCKWRLQNMKDVLPPYTREPRDQKYESGPKVGKYRDSQMVVVMTVYYRACSEYPKGCYAVIGGDQFVLHRQTWTAMMLNADGQQEEECLMLPIAQNRCLDDDITDNGNGIGIAEHLGPADEVRATALGFELEHMFRSANPIPFLPIGSVVQPKQFILRDGNPVFVNPNGKPEMEKVEPLSATVPLVRTEMGTEMDDESGLQQAGQGVEGPTVKSGIHAQTIVQEALKALTQIKDNAGDFYVRLHRIILEHARAFISVPDLLSYTGEDGSYKAKEFTRTDFRNTKRVTIQKGTFTMHTLLAKQEMANNAFDRKVIDAEQYQDIMASGISPVLGTQEDPALMRVRRQLDAFNEGPSKEWLAAQQAFESQQLAIQQAQAMNTQWQQSAMAAQQAGMAAPPPPPMNPAAQEAPLQPPPGPFSKRIPTDMEPLPAKIRHRQIKRAMESTKFEAFPPQWQQLLLAEYTEMKNCAGIMTVPEIQQAKAQEAQQQQVATQQQAAAAQAQAGKVEAAANEDKRASGAREDAKLALDRDRLGLERQKTEADIREKTPVEPRPTRMALVRDGKGKVTHVDVMPHAPAAI